MSLGEFCLSNQENKIEKTGEQEYTIKIIPHGGADVRSIRLPERWIRYGIASLAAGAVLMAGAFGYSTYSSYSLRNEAAQIERLQQVNNVQQEQLLQLSKKASSLQSELDELNQVEMELRQITGVEGGGEEALSGSGGDGTHNGQGGPVGQDLKIENVSAVLDDLEKRIAVRRASIQQLREAMRQQQELIAYQESVNASTPSIWPSSGDVSSPYGLRWGGSDYHPGIDIANDIGTPIVATADGVVTDAGWNAGGYGNMVDIDHGNGYMTRYAHAESVVVSPGQAVKRGEIIAYMGSTGYSTGPHVHYEVRINDRPVNPVGYL